MQTEATPEMCAARTAEITSDLTLNASDKELDRLVAAYRGTADRLADWLEHNVPEGLAVFTLPEPHWRRMRTANPIERAIQQEIKRRTSKVRVFPNRDALLRLATAVLVEIDEDWATSNRIYINWDNPDA
jgi:transposase-like protein